ncbi:hypothetical protein [Corynebacterium xerosis]|uniref:hypothetical protein n=1 Tax=Corynebacterium xerosis TaxID=1725 RepID=UPI000A702861|nr:hypothetical protein [Corynebacterium xerosis]SQB95832.1 Uncharacterised protein [Clostridium paraputrificum]
MPDIQVREARPDESAVGHVAIVALVFVALPLGLSILFNFLFSRIGGVRGEHYELDFK